MATSMPRLADPSDSPPEQWPCANCHAIVSEDRCPFCHGIQKPVRRSRNEQMAQRAWIERVSPRTVSSPQNILTQERLQTMIMPSVTSDFDLIQEEVDEELDRNSEKLSLRGLGDDNRFVGERPNNPVAFLLASTSESPLPSTEFGSEDDEGRKKGDESNLAENGPAGKKPRILFAM